MNHIHPITTKVTTAQRSLLLGHQPAAIWFTGLSGSGKSTLAVELESQLHARGIKTYLLDGDNVRNGLNAGLGFSGADRQENIRRIGEVTKLFVDAGLVVLSAFISPFRADRVMVRDLVGKDRFIEVFVDCPLEECERRDVKGLYAKARQGVIREFTGIDSPYEAPVSPDVHVHTNVSTPEQSVETILKNILPRIKSV